MREKVMFCLVKTPSSRKNMTQKTSECYIYVNIFNKCVSNEIVKRNRLRKSHLRDVWSLLMASAVVLKKSHQCQCGVPFSEKHFYLKSLFHLF